MGGALRGPTPARRMSPPAERSRPSRRSGAALISGRAGADDPNLPCAADSLGAQLRRRRGAAWRCEPLPVGSRDPLGLADGRRTPCNYSLTRAELLEEIERCSAAGWIGWEIVERFVDPRTVAA